MSFDKIFQQWETGINHSNRKKTFSPVSSAEQSVWLDKYLPDKSQIAEKDSMKPPPVSAQRTKWLNMEAQDTLDLHGMTELEARTALTGFIQSMMRRGLRKGLIIHGKGRHSSEGSILAPMVRQFLEGTNKVGQFGHPKARDGGKGATWFLLRAH